MTAFDRARNWPLAAKVIAALALTLGPLGVGAAWLAVQNYRAVVVERGRAAAAWALPPFEPGISFGQLLGIGLPVLMWLAALLIGWLVASRLIVRPLTRLRVAVGRYADGDKTVRLGGETFLSREVDALAAAFDDMADRLDRHSDSLQAALAEQRRLTREVHHRVKNNLQIVSSLLSLQARDAKTAEVARAYAQVQARVAALAVVHRWMYDSAAPGGRDVDLRALASDLCSGLEQSLTASEGISISIACHVDRVFVGQDTAVPIAFLITELVSCAARLSSPAPLSVAVHAIGTADSVRLTIAAPPFASDPLHDNGALPTQRIIQGMARQLRAPLLHDATGASYAIDIALPVSPAGS